MGSPPPDPLEPQNWKQKLASSTDNLTEKQQEILAKLLEVDLLVRIELAAEHIFFGFSIEEDPDIDDLLDAINMAAQRVFLGDGEILFANQAVETIRQEVYFKLKRRTFMGASRNAMLFLYGVITIPLYLFVFYPSLFADVFNPSSQILGIKLITFVAAFLSGLIGGSVSVMINATRELNSGSRPLRQLGPLSTFTRPLIGAILALFVIFAIKAGLVLNSFINPGPTNEEFGVSDYFLIVMGFVAGFTESFAVGIIERIGQSSEVRKPEREAGRS